jgi:hypothetical protein
MIICVIYDGQMIISPDMVIYNTGILTAGEIDQLVKTGSSVSKEAITKEINGAGLYTNKNVLHKGTHSKKKVGGVITMA